MKENVYSGLSSARDSASAGAGVAYERSSEFMANAGTVTKESLDHAAEKTKEGALYTYEVGLEAGTTVKTKLFDDTGITDHAVAAGGYVYSTGSQGVSYVNSKIDENETLA